MTDDNLTGLTADIVSAYVANNSVPTGNLGELIASVHASLNGLSGGAAQGAQEKPEPAVPIKKSVTPHGITCLFDGKKFKSLKRHLSANHGMTPDQYRAHFDLPASYPMVAPEYAVQRSQIALSLGLGRKPKTPEPVAESGKPAEAKRVRTKKAAPATGE